jgi:hypothetical protein
MHIRGGRVGPHAWNGWASPFSKERHIQLSKVNGGREGGDGVVEEDVADNTTERQGEVAHANMVGGGIGSPPCINLGWQGGTLLGGQGA